MSTKILCSIHDTKSQTWTQPAAFHNHAEALRAFTALANDGGTTFGRWPEDYSMYIVGTFNELDGTIIARPPEHLALAASLTHKAPLKLVAEEK